MSVYFIAGNELIKIGFSKMVRTRVSGIIASTPFDCKFIGYMPGGRDIEKHLHRQFEADRHHGEWFRATPELVAFVDAIAIKSMPDDEAGDAFDRFAEIETMGTEKCAAAAQAMFQEMGIQDREDWVKISMMAKALGLSAGRLRAIWMGDIVAVTYAEFQVIAFANERAPHTRSTANTIEPTEPAANAAETE